MTRAAALLAAAIVAGAAPGQSRAAPRLPDGMAIEAHEQRLVVRQGKVRAPLLPQKGDFDELRLHVTDGKVHLAFRYHCSWSEERTLDTTLDGLRARLANETALRAYRGGDFTVAAAGFRRALDLDATHEAARFNLASALVRLGKTRDALDVLAPALASRPLATYLHVAADRDLAPLLAEPPLAALRPSRPGTASVPPRFTREGEASLVAGVSRDRSTLALALDHDEADESITHHWIECRRVTDGESVGVIDLGTTEGEYRRLAKEANRQLAALGFDAPADLVVGERAADGNAIRLPKLRLGVALGSDGTVRVLRGDKILLERKEGHDRLTRVEALPSAGALLWRVQDSDTHYPCESQSPPHVTVAPLPGP